jgi:hypothetical protein
MVFVLDGENFLGFKLQITFWVKMPYNASVIAGDKPRFSYNFMLSVNAFKALLLFAVYDIDPNIRTMFLSPNTISLLESMG